MSKKPQSTKAKDSNTITKFSKQTSEIGVSQFLFCSADRPLPRVTDFFSCGGFVTSEAGQKILKECLFRFGSTEFPIYVERTMSFLAGMLSLDCECSGSEYWQIISEELFEGSGEFSVSMTLSHGGGNLLTLYEAQTATLVLESKNGFFTVRTVSFPESSQSLEVKSGGRVKLTLKHESSGLVTVDISSGESLIQLKRLMKDPIILGFHASKQTRLYEISISETYNSETYTQNFLEGRKGFAWHGEKRVEASNHPYYLMRHLLFVLTDWVEKEHKAVFAELSNERLTSSFQRTFITYLNNTEQLLSGENPEEGLRHYLYFTQNYLRRFSSLCLFDQPLSETLLRCTKHLPQISSPKSRTASWTVLQISLDLPPNLEFLELAKIGLRLLFATHVDRPRRAARRCAFFLRGIHVKKLARATHGGVVAEAARLVGKVVAERSREEALPILIRIGEEFRDTKSGECFKVFVKGLLREVKEDVGAMVAAAYFVTLASRWGGEEAIIKVVERLKEVLNLGDDGYMKSKKPAENMKGEEPLDFQREEKKGKRLKGLLLGDSDDKMMGFSGYRQKYTEFLDSQIYVETEEKGRDDNSPEVAEFPEYGSEDDDLDEAEERGQGATESEAVDDIADNRIFFDSQLDSEFPEFEAAQQLGNDKLSFDGHLLDASLHAAIVHAVERDINIGSIQKGSMSSSLWGQFESSEEESLECDAPPFSHSPPVKLSSPRGKKPKKLGLTIDPDQINELFTYGGELGDKLNDSGYEAVSLAAAADELKRITVPLLSQSITLNQKAQSSIFTDLTILGYACLVQQQTPALRQHTLKLIEFALSFPNRFPTAASLASAFSGLASSQQTHTFTAHKGGRLAREVTVLRLLTSPTNTLQNGSISRWAKLLSLFAQRTHTTFGGLADPQPIVTLFLKLAAASNSKVGEESLSTVVLAASRVFRTSETTAKALLQGETGRRAAKFLIDIVERVEGEEIFAGIYVMVWLGEKERAEKMTEKLSVAAKEFLEDQVRNFETGNFEGFFKLCEHNKRILDRCFDSLEKVLKDVKSIRGIELTQGIKIPTSNVQPLNPSSNSSRQVLNPSSNSSRQLFNFSGSLSRQLLNLSPRDLPSLAQSALSRIIREITRLSKLKGASTTDNLLKLEKLYTSQLAETKKFFTNTRIDWSYFFNLVSAPYSQNPPVYPRTSSYLFPRLQEQTLLTLRIIIRIV